MGNSKLKFWAREILIFWVSLLVMVAIYLLFEAGAMVNDYFRNKEIVASNQRVREAIAIEQAKIDSLTKTPQFILRPVRDVDGREKLQGLWKLLSEKKMTELDYSAFQKAYLPAEMQRELYDGLIQTRLLRKEEATFEEFQKEAFGDYLNPLWGKNQKKIEQYKSKKRSLEFEFKSDRKTHIHLELFALVWFAITYPLRGIVFSILWAYRTLKEK